MASSQKWSKKKKKWSSFSAFQNIFFYFEKNDGSATIQEIVTTDSQTNGSIEILGNISSSLTTTASFGVSQVTTKAAIGASANLNQTYTLFVKSGTGDNHTYAGYFMNSWANSGGGGIYIQNNGSGATQAINSNDTFVLRFFII